MGLATRVPPTKKAKAKKLACSPEAAKGSSPMTVGISAASSPLGTAPHALVVGHSLSPKHYPKKRGRPRVVVNLSDQVGSADAELAAELEYLRPKVEGLHAMSDTIHDPACVKEIRRHSAKAQKHMKQKVTSAKKRVVKLSRHAIIFPMACKHLWTQLGSC